MRRRVRIHFAAIVSDARPDRGDVLSACVGCASCLKACKRVLAVRAMSGVDQTKSAFQKQSAVFIGSKKLLTKKGGGREARYWKNVGLGIKTPKEAIDGNYVDKKCPFTGNVTIRGRLLAGTVKTTKMDRTIIIRRDYLHYIRKYHRYEKRHKTLPAHCSPCFRISPGDQVLVGQCRPLSKTVRFNVLKITNKAGGAGKKGFEKF